MRLPRPRGSRDRQLATTVRDYFGKDDMREGYTVAYTKYDIPYVAAVAGPMRRRQVGVTDHLGAQDFVELKSVDLVLPTVGDKLTSSQLQAVHEFARQVTEANSADGGGLIRRAWERTTAGAVELAEDLHPEKYVEMSSLDMLPYVFPRTPSPSSSPASPSISVNEDHLRATGAALAEKLAVPPEVMFAYATHRLLSEDGFFFKPFRRGAFAPRRAQELHALTRETVEQAAENSAVGVMWQRLDDAIAAPPAVKPPRDHFLDGSLLELRMESLEAFALGEGCYSSAQKAAAADTLGRVDMQATERGAFDLLVAIGRWAGFENLALRRYDIPVSFGGARGLRVGIQSSRVVALGLEFGVND